MRVDIPILLTPMNIVGLAHASTILQMSRKIDFTDTDAYLFNGTNTGAEKNNFIINYELSAAQVAYIRYRIVFQNGQMSHWSPIKMVSNNNSRVQEYTLDTFSAIPATPRLSIADYDYSNVPHTDINISSNELNFYVGTGEHISSNWYLMDKNDTILWKSEDNEFNLNSITISKKEFLKDGIYKVCLEKNVSAGGVEFKTLMGSKIFNATDSDNLDFRDKSLEIDFDNFVLYSNGQSKLFFTHGISGFKHLSIKFYDRNGILTGDEIIAKESPVYINTSLIEPGKSYGMQVIAFYTDGEGIIHNTLMRDRNYIAQKHSLANVIPNVDYGTMLELGFHEVKGYQDEGCTYLNCANSFLDGSSAIYIKEGMIFLGYWLEGGYVLNDKFINISPLGLNKASKIQITQKQNGNYVIIGQVIAGSSNVNITEFKLLASNDNIYNISIINGNIIDNVVFANVLKTADNNRMLFSNTSNRNIIASNANGGTASWGTDIALLGIREQLNNVLYTRNTYNGNGVSRVCETSLVDTLAYVELNKVSTNYHLSISYLNVNNSENIIKTLVLELNTLTHIANPVMAELKTKLFDLGLHTDGLEMALVSLNSDNLLLTIKDIKTNGGFYNYYRFNIITNTWHLVNDITGTGKDHLNQATAGYNIYKTIAGKPPLKLK